MGNILVSLISDQAIPNLEMIKEKPVDAYLFILTEQMKEKLSWLKVAAGLKDSSIIQELIVDAFSFEDIDKKLSAIVSDDHHYLVNLTGGTKIMSLAVSDFFKDIDCELFYIPGKNDSYVRIFPGIKKPYISFKTKITLEEYVLAYGFTIRHKGKLLTSTKQTEKVFDYFLNHFNHEKDGEALKILRKKREEKKSFQQLGDNFEVPGFLTRLQYIPENPDHLTKNEVKYLTGEWFEDYVYSLIKNKYQLSDEEIGVGWQLQKGENNTPNEFDVLYIKDKKLNIIECKTSVMLSGTSFKKNIITETIYKVDSLRNNLGLFAKTNIFTLSDLNESDASIRSSIDRAKEFKIMICGKADFQDETFPENIFKK
jgi:hypothetical protein